MVAGFTRLVWPCLPHHSTNIWVSTSPTMVSTSQSGGYDEETGQAEYFGHGATTTSQASVTGTGVGVGHSTATTGGQPQPSQARVVLRQVLVTSSDRVMGLVVRCKIRWILARRGHTDSNLIRPRLTQQRRPHLLLNLHLIPYTHTHRWRQHKHNTSSRMVTTVKHRLFLVMQCRLQPEQQHIFGGGHQGFGSGLVYSQPHQQQAQHPQHPNHIYNQSTWTG
eukprot:TRINITY_DN1796_c0_g1_i1.p1 TRINITY_DN1796_c0_g1~~TRINITY_DN1796_c0_g1_i1.p1  ORF type:complete len:235 (-),score=31.09 TRINITY_DN1796_c0_g1_i1:398-1063(-)